MSLRGRRVLIVAGTPSGEYVLEAEEALSTMIRAVVAQGGVVDLIADNSLALLGAVVAGEYFEPQHAEGFRGEERRVESAIRIVSPGLEDDEEFHRMSETGQIEFDEGTDVLRAVSDAAGRSAAMVCIGDASFGEFASRFRQQSAAPIFAFALTGPAESHLMDVRGVSAIDAELDHEEPPRSRRGVVDRERRRDDRFESNDEQDLPVDFEFQFPPLVLAAQVIVERIAENETPPPNRLRAG